MINVLILFVIILILLLNLKSKENFPKVFGTGVVQKECSPQNNCFPGSYHRTQQYQNVCQPDFGLLNRTKVSLQEECLRDAGRMIDTTLPDYKIKCFIDEHLNRKCVHYDGNSDHILNNF